MVCPSPMGSGLFSYASSTFSGRANRCRSTRSTAASTGSDISRPDALISAMSCERRWANTASSAPSASPGVGLAACPQDGNQQRHHQDRAPQETSARSGHPAPHLPVRRHGPWPPFHYPKLVTRGRKPIPSLPLNARMRGKHQRHCERANHGRPARPRSGRHRRRHWHRRGHRAAAGGGRLPPDGVRLQQHCRGRGAAR